MLYQKTDARNERIDVRIGMDAAVKSVQKSMPRSKNVSWKTQSTPQTPLQRGVFIDRCTEWLVKESSIDSGCDTLFKVSERTNCNGNSSTKPFNTLGLTTRDLKLHEVKPCSFCSNQDSNAIVANPFSHMDIVLVCNSCMGI